jgi:hypothetical protein
MNQPISTSQDRASSADALQALKAVRNHQTEERNLLGDFIAKSRSANVPVIKVFTPTGSEVLPYEVHQAFLFTKRDDYQFFYWYLSPRLGMCVADTRITDQKNWVPFEEWDPEGDLYMFAYWGATGMSPDEHIKRGIQ